VAIKPGLLPVVQVTDVEVAAETGQSIPSKVMIYNVVSVGKFEPVKVTSVPPTTVPYLGEIDSRLVVKEPLYSTVLRSMAVSPTVALASQV
jgi:hypothetical protein